MALRLNVDVLQEAAQQRGHARQEDIAAHAGVDRSMLCKTIAGSVKPSLRMVRSLALAYGKAMEDLVSDDGAAA